LKKIERTSKKKINTQKIILYFEEDLKHKVIKIIDFEPLIVKEVNIINYLLFKDFKIRFQNNIQYLIGPPGSGLSTFLSVFDFPRDISHDQNIEIELTINLLPFSISETGVKEKDIKLILKNIEGTLNVANKNDYNYDPNVIDIINNLIFLDLDYEFLNILTTIPESFSFDGKLNEKTSIFEELVLGITGKKITDLKKLGKEEERKDFLMEIENKLNEIIGSAVKLLFDFKIELILNDKKTFKINFIYQGNTLNFEEFSGGKKEFLLFLFYYYGKLTKLKNSVIIIDDFLNWFDPALKNFISNKLEIIAKNNQLIIGKSTLEENPHPERVIYFVDEWKIHELEKKSKYREKILENIVKKSDPIGNYPVKNNFLILARQWNSWYPSSFNIEGGCYFFNLNEEIIIIDPGFNTLKEIKKRKLDIRLIRYIFITHFHPDHFESLVGLITRLTSHKNKLTVYLNTTAYDQFKIYARGSTEYRELRPGINLELKMEKKTSDFQIKVQVGEAFHKEIGGAMNSIGLKFKLINNKTGISYIIGFMSDTDGSSEYIKIYTSFYKECDILIPHLGAIHGKADGSKHLYKDGLKNLIYQLNPINKYIFIGEFGFELASESEFKRVFSDLIPDNIGYKDLIESIYKFLNPFNSKGESDLQKISFFGQIFSEIFRVCITKVQNFYPSLEVFFPFLTFSNGIIINYSNLNILSGDLQNLLTSLGEILSKFDNDSVLTIWKCFVKTVIFQSGNFEDCLNQIKQKISDEHLIKVIDNYEKFIKSWFQFFQPELSSSLLDFFINRLAYYSLGKDFILEDLLRNFNFDININETEEDTIIHFLGLAQPIKFFFEGKEWRLLILLLSISFITKLFQSNPIIDLKNEPDGRELVCKYFNEHHRYKVLPVHPSYKIFLKNSELQVEGRCLIYEHVSVIPLEHYNRDWKIIPKNESDKKPHEEYINIIPEGYCQNCIRTEQSISDEEFSEKENLFFKIFKSNKEMLGYLRRFEMRYKDKSEEEKSRLLIKEFFKRPSHFKKISTNVEFLLMNYHKIGLFNILENSVFFEYFREVIKNPTSLEICLIADFIEKRYDVDIRVLKSEFFAYYKRLFTNVFFPLIESPLDNKEKYKELLEYEDILGIKKNYQDFLNILRKFGHPFDYYAYHLEDNFLELDEK